MCRGNRILILNCKKTTTKGGVVRQYLNLTVLTVDHSTMMVEISNKNYFLAKNQETFVSTKLNHFEQFLRNETAKLAFLSN